MKVPFDMTCPYVKGALLEFLFNPYKSGQGCAWHLQATVVSVFTPFTNSQVLLVEVTAPPPGLPKKVVVKLYDRRYVNAREEIEQPWSPEIERAAVKRWTAIRAGVEEDDYEDIDEDDYDEARWEEYMWRYTKTLCRTEQDGYGRLQRFQGNLLPTLFGSVQLLFAFEGDTLDQHAIPGVILEYIPYPSLDELSDPSIVASNRRVVRETFDAVASFSSYGVQHNDIRAHNVKVSLDSSKPRIVIYDFGIAVLRSEGQDDNEWAGLVHLVDDLLELQVLFTRERIREKSPLMSGFYGEVECERSFIGFPATFFTRWYNETTERCTTELARGVDNHKSYKLKPEVYAYFKNREELAHPYLYPRPGSPDFSS